MGLKKPLPLRRRFLLHNLLLVGGLLAAGGISVWRLHVLHNEVDLSPNVFAEVRTIGNVATETGIVRGLLSNPTVNREAIVTRLTYAIGGLDQFIQVGTGYGQRPDGAMAEAYVPINQSAASARAKLQKVLDSFTGPQAPVAESQQKAVDDAMDDLDQVASSCVRFMSSHQQTASSQLATNLALIGTLSFAAVLAAVALSIVHDRLVVAPLQRLREGVRAIADARFAQKLDVAAMSSSPEFLDLATEFNRMAEELDGFYSRLEEQVRAKSRELVRSERLASVGFLAAGVAHEINNPLNIISGYAELTLKQLGAFSGEVTAEARESVRIIRDEAFRCKEITEKLLSLSRSGSEGRERLDLSGVAREVVSMTKGLGNYKGRQLTVKLDPAEPLEVEANLTEMKQVLLNLTINALESIPQAGGEVCIEGRRTRDWVELCVNDNGRGMEPDMLRHVFEPFFTVRRGPGRRGTGLGLSITHAIVENHGGRIYAESDGIGLGARFTVCLPARNVGRQSVAR